MQLKLLKKPNAQSLKNEQVPEKRETPQYKSNADLELILQKTEIQKHLQSIQDTKLFEEKADLISKLSKIQLIRIKYENKIQEDLNTEFYANPTNKFLIGVGVAAAVSGICLLAAMHPAGYIVTIFGVASIIMSLYRKKLVSDLSEEEIVKRISAKVNATESSSSR